MRAGLSFPRGPLLVLTIGAHPDDIEIGCGGALLALQRREDIDIRALVMTGTAERQHEAIAAAEEFGNSQPPAFGGFPDGRLPEFWGPVRDVLHAFRDTNPEPDVVFAPRTEDAHQDHAMVGRLISTVWRGPMILHYEIPKWDGDLAHPNVYLPLSDEYVERKIQLINDSFPSQRKRAWWDDEFFLGIMRLRGAETLHHYAEAFTSNKLTLSAETQ